MRNATRIQPTTMKFLCVVFVIYYMEIGIVWALSDEVPLQSNNDNPQMDDEMLKRDWNKDLHIWGKRGWNNLHGGWGLKRSIPSSSAAWTDQTYPSAEKRAWQNLQSGWGKRFLPNDDEYAASRQLSALLDLDNMNQLYSSEYGNDFYQNDDDKRNWDQFHGGWGKRSGGKWEKFRGSWGKREPAWSNLKGIWGKRSIINPDQIAQ